MSLIKPVGYDGGVMRQYQQGDVIAAAEVIQTLATNGAGALTGALLASGIINRTTVASNVADTTDNANTIVAAIGGLSVSSALQNGTTWRVKYRNNATGIITLTGGTGVTISGTAAIPAGASAELLVSLDNVTPTSVVACSYLSASAIVTGMTLAQTSAITVGQLATGTDVQAAATVISVQPGVGVTLSSTLNATNTLGTITFAPKVTITNIGMTAATAAPGVDVITALATVGAGTLTAAAVVGKVITRSGSVAAYTDTTDTAANIIAAMPSAVTGSSVRVSYRNTVNFPATIAGGASVTTAGELVAAPLSELVLEFIVTGASTMSCTGISCQPLTILPQIAQGTLTTVGAGTPLAASIAAGDLLRTGATSAFTDTTDTAANIIAAVANCQVGQSWMFTYQNNCVTGATATITGGASVTVSGVTIVPAGCWAEYIVTMNGASTVTMVGIGMGQLCELPSAKFTTSAVSNGTATAGDITGADFVVLNLTANGANAYTVRTAAQMLTDIPNGITGKTWITRIISAGNNTVTLTADGGATVTITGTATIATNTWTDFFCKFTSATAMTMQVIGAGDKV